MYFWFLIFYRTWIGLDLERARSSLWHSIFQPLTQYETKHQEKNDSKLHMVLVGTFGKYSNQLDGPDSELCKQLIQNDWTFSACNAHCPKKQWSNKESSMETFSPEISSSEISSSEMPSSEESSSGISSSEIFFNFSICLLIVDYNALL